MKNQIFKQIILAIFALFVSEISLGQCTYCTTSGNTTYLTGIRKVIFNTINTKSAKPSGYGDYSTISTLVLKGSSYNLTVYTNTGGDHTVYTKAWIDWNQDCDFDDAGEEYNIGSTTNQTEGITSLSPLSITIPITAKEGVTRMRVSTKYPIAPTSCETDFDGEVEDYKIIVSKIIVNPTSLNFGDQAISTTSSVESYTVKAANLTENLTIVAPTGFLISLNNENNFNDTIILPPTSGNVDLTTVYIKFSPTAIQSYNGSIIHSSDTSIQNLTITAKGVSGSTPIINISPIYLEFTNQITGTTSSPKSFRLKAKNLTNTLAVQVPNGYKVSTVSGSGYTNFVSYTPVSGMVDTTVYIVFNPLAAQSYNNGISITSNGASLRNLPVYAVGYSTYCEATGSAAPDQTGITLVNFNTINNATPSKTVGYNDFTTISTNVEKDSTYQLTVKVNTAGNYTAHTKVWIDWNQNYSFNDAGEEYDLGTATNVTNGSSSLCPLNITIPANATYGTTRMRVFTKWSNDNSDPTPCLTASFAEVEDYAINIIYAEPYLNVPFVEDFDSYGVPALPQNWSYSSYSNRKWQTNGGSQMSSPNSLVTYPESNLDKNEWVYTPAIALNSSKTYLVSFKVRAPGYNGIAEKMEFKMGLTRDTAGMTTLLWKDNNMLYSDGVTRSFEITPATSGKYYFSWHAYSVKDLADIKVDDISIIEAPVGYTINYNVINGNGTITATVDGNIINNGDTIDSGKNIIFNAHANVGYKVKEWKINNTIIANHTDSVYTLSNLSSNDTVTVEFVAKNNVATLSDLKVNSTTIEGFVPTTYTYNVVLPFGTTIIPEVTATTIDTNATTYIANVIALPGTATVLVTAENGLNQQNYTVNFTISSSINTFDNSTISIFPIPANDELNIKSTLEMNHISIVNIHGQIVYESNVNAKDAIVNVSNLSNGLYHLQINTVNGFVVKKISIKK